MCELEHGEDWNHSQAARRNPAFREHGVKGNLIWANGYRERNGKVRHAPKGARRYSRRENTGVVCRQGVVLWDAAILPLDLDVH